MKEIVVDVSVNQTRVALLESGEPVEFIIERNENWRMVGNIYKGIVQNVLPGMQAAFIDVGLDKNVFLYVKDALTNTIYDEELECAADARSVKISELLKVGQTVMVQVIKDPIDTKSARVSTHITLPGRYVVLMPTVDYIGVSRRIENEDERERLKKIAAQIKPRGMGLIIRTVGEGCESEDFISDIHFLSKLWEGIKEKGKEYTKPSLIHSDMDITLRTVRDLLTKDIDKFVINDKHSYEKVIDLVDIISPQLKSKVQYYSKNSEVFQHYHLESKLGKLLNRKTWLSCGGYIVIDQTEAMTCIDVNTGKFVGTNDLKDTVLIVNIEAAREIAKQLRLRDIGGIIIIDFIDMTDEDHKKLLLEALRNALKKDRSKTTVFGMTQLGLVEMARKKVRPRLENVLQSPCPYCKGTGKILSIETIAKNIELEIDKAFIRTDIKAVYIELHPEVEAYLCGENDSRLKAMESEYGRKIIINSIASIHREEFVVEAIEIKETIDKYKVL